MVNRSPLPQRYRNDLVIEAPMKKALSPITEGNEQDEGLPTPPQIPRISQPIANKPSSLDSEASSKPPLHTNPSPTKESTSQPLFPSPEHRPSAFSSPEATPKLTSKQTPQPDHEGMADFRLPPSNHLPHPSRADESSSPQQENNKKQNGLPETIIELRETTKKHSKHVREETERFIAVIEKEAKTPGCDYNKLQRLVEQTKRLLSHNMSTADYCQKAKEWGKQQASPRSQRIARGMLAIAAVLIVASAIVIPLFPIALVVSIASISVSSALAISGFFGLRNTPVTNRMLALENALTKENNNSIASTTHTTKQDANLRPCSG